MIVPAVSLRPVSDIPLVLFWKILLSLFRAGMTRVHRKLRTPGISESHFCFFCCLKAGRHIGIEQHLQGRKEGGERLQKVRWLDQDCNKCGRQLNSWDARLSKTLAYKYPCCESCIAGEYDMSAERLRDRMENYFGMRPCQGL